MKKWIIAILLALSACHCYPNIEPAHAEGNNCTTTCRTDSGGHVICKMRCH